MLKMVDGTGIIGVDMICPLGVSTPQPPNYDRVELEGAGMLVLPNSLDAPLERLELGGKTEQVTTTGAQLFDSKLFGTVSNTGGATVTNNGDGTFSVSGNGTLTKIFNVSHEYSKEQTLSMLKAGKLHARASANVFPYPSFVIFSNGQWTELNMDSTTEKTADITEEMLNSEDLKSRFRFFGKIDNAIKSGTVKIMLYQDGNGDYEPYTGGKPSPSPEYPQEIKNSGKWNEETQKYEVDVKVTWKNLFNREKAKDVSKWTPCAFNANFVEIAVYVGTGSTVTASNNVKIDNPVYYYGVALKSSEDIKYFICYPGYPNSKDTHTFTATEDYIYVRCNKTSLNEVIGVCGGLQIEIGASRTDFESYKEQTITLTSDRPLTKWDKLVEQGGQIGWLYGTKKYTVTGSENYIFGGAQYYSGISTNMYINAVKNMSGEGVCRRLKSIIGIWDKSNNTKDGFCINSGNQIHMRFFNNLLGVSDDATMEEKKAAYIAYLKKEYEKGTPYEIVYQSLEPEFIPLPQSEQNAIRALKTYYPTTVITVDGGEVDPDIKVTYRKEI